MSKLVGKEIHGYRLNKIIGTGSLAGVFRATQLSLAGSGS